MRLVFDSHDLDVMRTHETYVYDSNQLSRVELVVDLSKTTEIESLANSLIGTSSDLLILQDDDGNTIREFTNYSLNSITEHIEGTESVISLIFDKFEA